MAEERVDRKALMAETARPKLVAPRQVATLDAVRTMTGGFDIDAWHVMEERDNALIADEVLHGPGSSKFVYSFDIAGQREPATGISVVGARHLANHYKGLKHRLVAATQKTGALFIFTSYPAENMPMTVSCSVVPELENEDDFYSAICEVIDVKTGNSLQSERRELRYGERQGGGQFERPHYATIAQSKAYRNAVLALIPQDIAIRWKLEMLRLKKEEVITESVIDQKRANVLQFAAQRAIALDRQAIDHLTLDQIAGLGDAAREGRLPAFVEAARALGLEVAQESTEAARTPAPAAAAPAESANRRRAATVAPAQTTAAAAPNRPEEPADRPRENAAVGQQPSEGAPPQPGGERAPPGGQPAQQTAQPAQRRRVNFEA
jgi:hypothetical protein